MSKLSSRSKATIVFVAVIAVGYGAILFWQSRNPVPQSFSDARSKGAIIAQNIVNLSNQSTADLAKVNEYDKTGDYQDALTLTENIITQSQELRNQAVDLSNQVQIMTQSLSDISSLDARQAALESISSRLALINQLINYSGDLGKLLDVLQSHFAGTAEDGNQIQGLVNQINTDVNAINSFNSQAGQAMDRFDKIVNQ